MKQVKIIIERTADLYTAYAENIEGVYAAGESVAEVKQSVEEAIRLLKKYNDPGSLPPALKSHYQLVFKLDAQSFLNYYRGIFTKSALERITGINQKQIQHYASGLKKPRPNTSRKIQSALHKLGNELLAVEL